MQAGRTLFDAAREGKIGEIYELLSYGADPNALDYNVPTIWYAVQRFHEPAAMVLLKETDSKLLSNKNLIYDCTMLHLAATRDMGCLVNAAIARGANPNALNERNVPAIYYAVARSNKEIAIALLGLTDAKLLNNLNPAEGKTILHLAAERNWDDFIKLALDRGINPDILDGEGIPAIYYAVESQQLAAAEVLLKVTDSRLLNKQVPVHRNCTFLHKAASWGGYAEFIKIAIAKGADPTIKNAHGKSVLDIIKASDKFSFEQKLEFLDEAAWARRGSLVMLRRRFKQAWEAECDAAQASTAVPDA